MDLDLGTGVGTLGSKSEIDKAEKLENETPSAFVVITENDPILKANPNLKAGDMIPSLKYNEMLKGSQQTSTTQKTLKLEGYDANSITEETYQDLLNVTGLDDMGLEGLKKFLLENKGKTIKFNEDNTYGGFVGE